MNIKDLTPEAIGVLDRDAALEAVKGIGADIAAGVLSVQEALGALDVLKGLSERLSALEAPGDQIQNFREVDAAKGLGYEFDSHGLVVNKCSMSIDAGDYQIPFAKGTESDDAPPWKATAAQLTKINRFSKRPQNVDSCIVVSAISTDNSLDADLDHMTPKAMGELINLDMGSAGTTDHSRSANDIIARVFDAEMATPTSVREWFFIPNSEFTAQDKILNGLWNAVSISYASLPQDLRCDLCGMSIFDDRCVHDKGKVYGGKLCTVSTDGIYRKNETSFVMIGKNRNAGVEGTRSANVVGASKGVTTDPPNDPSTIPLGQSTIEDNSLMSETTIPIPAASEAPATAAPAAPQAQAVDTAKLNQDIVESVKGAIPASIPVDTKGIEDMFKGFASALNATGLAEAVKGTIELSKSNSELMGKLIAAQVDIGAKIDSLGKMIETASHISVDATKGAVPQPTAPEQPKHWFTACFGDEPSENGGQQ